MSHPPPGPQYGHGPGYRPPPPWTPPPAIDPGDLRPSRTWYWLVPVPIVAGLLVAAFFAIRLVEILGTDLNHLRAPGSAVVALEAGDERGVYVQTAGAAGAGPAVGAADLACAVRDRRTDQPVPLDPAGGVTLTLNEDEYVERLRFRVDRKGSYAVTCTEPAGIPLAVGPRLSLGGFVVPLAGAIVAFLVGVAFGVAVAVIVAVRRSNDKQRLQREAVSLPPPPPPR